MPIAGIEIPRPPGGIGFSPFAAGPSAAAIQEGAVAPVDVQSGAVTPVNMGLITVRRVISHAEILTGASIPLINGLSGHWVFPFGSMLIASNTVLAAYGTTRTLSLRYVGAAYDLVTAQNFFQAGFPSKRYSAASANVNINLQTVSPEGIGVQLVFSGGNTAGDPGNQGMIAVSFMVSRVPISGF